MMAALNYTVEWPAATGFVFDLYCVLMLITGLVWLMRQPLLFRLSLVIMETHYAVPLK